MIMSTTEIETAHGLFDRYFDGKVKWDDAELAEHVRWLNMAKEIKHLGDEGREAESKYQYTKAILDAANKETGYLHAKVDVLEKQVRLLRELIVDIAKGIK